jgi:hypothetical protein
VLCWYELYNSGLHLVRSLPVPSFKSADVLHRRELHDEQLLGSGPRKDAPAGRFVLPPLLGRVVDKWVA